MASGADPGLCAYRRARHFGGVADRGRREAFGLVRRVHRRELSATRRILHSILFQAAPLIFVGVSAALAFRVRFWNLGIEGQMIWGGIARHRRVVLRHRAAGHAPAVDDAVRRARPAWPGSSFRSGCACAGASTRSSDAAAQLRGVQFSASPPLRRLARPEGRVSRTRRNSAPSSGCPRFGFGVSSALVLALVFTALSGWLVHVHAVRLLHQIRP